MLVTTGGVSVGVHDLVRQVEAELGVREVFWGVSVKPGKPISFGVREGRAGVRAAREPGLGARRLRAVRQAGGARATGCGGAWARLAARPVGRERARQRRAETSSSVRGRASATRGSCSSPWPGRESHMIARAAGADALVLVPRGEGELAAGASVRYLRLAESATGGAAVGPVTPPGAGAGSRPARRSSQRPHRRSLRGGRVRRVAASDQRRQLRADGNPAADDQHGSERHVADGGELGDVPRRVEAEVEAGRRRTRGAAAGPARPARSAPARTQTRGLA